MMTEAAAGLNPTETAPTLETIHLNELDTVQVEVLSWPEDNNPQPSLIPESVQTVMDRLDPNHLTRSLTDLLAERFPDHQAAFTRLINHQTTPENVAAISEITPTQEFQEIAVAFSETIKNAVMHPENYIRTCIAADTEVESMSDTDLDNNIASLYQNTEVLLDAEPMGHDKGHATRDLAHALIFHPIYRNLAASRADAIAGIISGWNHDNSTALTHRYHDAILGADHGAIAGLTTWLITEHSGFGENTRKLAAFASIAHTHYRQSQEVTVPPGYKRGPLSHELYAVQVPVEKNGQTTTETRYYGLANIATKAADRGDTLFGHFMIRTLLSRADASEQGGLDVEGGGDTVVKIKDQMHAVYGNSETPGSVLLHAVRFLESFTNPSVYSHFDHLNPVFQEYVQFADKHLHEIRQIIEGDTAGPDISDRQTLSDFLPFLTQFTQLPETKLRPVVEEILQPILNDYPPEAQTRWLQAFRYLETVSYPARLQWYRDHFSESFPKTRSLVFNTLSSQPTR